MVALFGDLLCVSISLFWLFYQGYFIASGPSYDCPIVRKTKCKYLRPMSPGGVWKSIGQQQREQIMFLFNDMTLDCMFHNARSFVAPVYKKRSVKYLLGKIHTGVNVADSSIWRFKCLIIHEFCCIYANNFLKHSGPIVTIMESSNV